MFTVTEAFNTLPQKMEVLTYVLYGPNEVSTVEFVPFEFFQDE